MPRAKFSTGQALIFVAVFFCILLVRVWQVPTSALTALSSRRRLAMYAPVGTLVLVPTSTPNSKGRRDRASPLDTRALLKRTSILEMSKAHRLGSYREGLALDNSSR